MKETHNTLRRSKVAAVSAAVVGTAASVWAYLSQPPAAFWFSYHIAFLFWWQVTMGFLGLALLRCIVRSTWGNATWPYLRASLVTLPVVTIFFLPLIAGATHIFPWAHESAEGHGNTFQDAYFDINFFWGRAAAYFVFWLLAGFIAMRTGTSVGEARLPRRFSSFALIAMVLSSTFAAFDWGMSLEPQWYSTIYGAMILMSGAVGALAILTLSVAWVLRMPRLPNLRVRHVMNDLGNLLLAFLMIWSYFAFSQYLIIWSGNLPSEVTWYLRRSAGSWKLVLLLVVALHFVLPFFLLLSRERKQHPRRLARVALLLVIANLVQSVWNYAPSLADQVRDVHWSLLTSLLALGGWWVLAYSLVLDRSLGSEVLMGAKRHE